MQQTIASLGVPETEEARRSYRELIVTTPGLGEFISGAILLMKPSVSPRKTAFPLLKSLPMQGLFPASKLTKVQRIWHGAPIGGVKVIAENGWFAARPSGTEDIYKIYGESCLGKVHLGRILKEAQTIVNEALGS